MAKARNTTNVRDRAIKAWKLAMKEPNYPVSQLVVRKARSKSTITVSSFFGAGALTWSYKGGSLRRINA